MPRGSHREKGDIAFAVAKAFEGVQTGTGSAQGGIERGGDRDRVLV